MDKILEALVSSSHSVPVKKAIVKKVVEAAEKEATEEQCQALYSLSARLILLGEDAFQKQVGLQVLEAYARYHRPAFERFFTRDFILGLLQQGYGPLDRKDPALVDYIHCCLRLLISCPSVLEIFRLLQTEVLRMVCERPDPALCARLATLLSDFGQCVPRDKAAILFCQQLVRTIGYFHCPANQERELREYVGQVTKVGTLLQNIWKAEPTMLLPSLQEVFSIISTTDPSFEPSIALASLVQHIPLQMITVLIRSLSTDQNVRDASMTKALCRMIDWLSWPLAHHVDTWVIALLKGLASVQKFTILIDVTLLKIELVLNRLWYPIVRQGALAVLAHMLLSFQHSPEAFHLVLPHVLPLVQSLRSDGLPSSSAFLLQFTELVHCMMYQYSGFPDLYDCILDAIKDLPRPSEGQMKLVLDQAAWTSQPSSSGVVQLAGRSETGHTGLVNLGNTCYMNSIIQTLFMTTDFRRQVLSLRLNDAHTLMKKLQLLFAFLAHTQRAAFSPRSFLEVSRPPWFNAGSQQDCSEYLRFLLDRLHEEEKTLQALLPAKPNVVSPDGDSGGEEEVCGETLIERMFGGRVSTAVRCLTCNSVSENQEPFTDLSLAFRPSDEPHRPAQGSVNGGGEERGTSPAHTPAADAGQVRAAEQPALSVPDLVNYFLAPEILDEDNAYFCERCCALRRAERGMRVVAAPEYLILTLLRFSYDSSCHVRRKILDNVSIPPLMRLPVHAAPPRHASPSSSPLQVDSPESSENLAKKLKPSRREEEEGRKKIQEGREGADRKGGEGERRGGDGERRGGEGERRGGEGEREGQEGGGVQSVPYVLSSVVMHSGMSSESGHYYSYGRNLTGAEPQGANQCSVGAEHTDGEAELSLAPSGQEVGVSGAGHEARDWLLFNDSRVTFTSFHSVQNVTSRFPKDTAYVLVYRRQHTPASPGNGGAGGANGLRLGAEPPLQKELMDAITKDNKLYLQEQELSARTRALQASSASCSSRPHGPDDNDPPGSCGPSGGGGGGGGGGGFNTVSRLVF